MTDNLLKQVSKEEYDELKDLVVAMGKALENTREYCWNLETRISKLKPKDDPNAPQDAPF